MKRAVRNILIVNGHPDPKSKGLCHALADAYAQGARQSGVEVRRIDVARLDFGFLHSQAEFEKGAVPAAIADVQADLLWTDHLVVIFPLWLGDMPALLKAGALDLRWLNVRGVPVAAAYNIVWRNKIHFYQSGRRLDVQRTGTRCS